MADIMLKDPEYFSNIIKFFTLQIYIAFMLNNVDIGPNFFIKATQIKEECTP